MDAFTSLYVWQMMYLQMRLYDENFGEKFSSYRRIFAQISIWDVNAQVGTTQSAAETLGILRDALDEQCWALK